MGTRFQNFRLYYVFNYQITIENQSNDTVQLLSRNWHVYDSLSELEKVEGEGVIGKKPIIHPHQTYTYNSHSFLRSPLGAMKGHYYMVNFSTAKMFKVNIPVFQLIAPPNLN